MNLGVNFSLLENLYQEMVLIFPKVLGGICFIILSYLALKLILYIVQKLSKLSKIENLNQTIKNNEIFKNSSIEFNLEKMILQFVKCVIILLIIIIGSDMFGLTIVSEQIGKLISYLPQFISAVLLFAGGLYLANYLKNLIHGIIKSIDINGAKIISNIIFYLIVIFTLITSLNQAGINTDLITNNLSMILGCIFLTLAIAFGLGSKDVIYRLLLSFYTNRNFEVGQKIQIEGEAEGVILSINNICMVLQTADGKIVFPIRTITDKKITVID